MWALWQSRQMMRSSGRRKATWKRRLASLRKGGDARTPLSNSEDSGFASDSSSSPMAREVSHACLSFACEDTDVGRRSPKSNPSQALMQKIQRSFRCIICDPRRRRAPPGWKARWTWASATVPGRMTPASLGTSFVPVCTGISIFLRKPVSLAIRPVSQHFPIMRRYRLHMAGGAETGSTAPLTFCSLLS